MAGQLILDSGGVCEREAAAEENAGEENAEHEGSGHRFDYSRRSKESVNRALAAVMVLGGLTMQMAQAQVALVVGSVRDQHGAAIVGARVTAGTRSGVRAVLTATDGTFALPAQGVTSIAVACRYCAPASFAVTAGQPVVAIVRRYDALALSSPSSSDLASLPYAHVESAVSLQPFSLLRQTTAVYPGSELSDRGLQPANALLVDAGVPNYDVVFGDSPYSLIPADYEQAAQIVPASNAFLYGDQAGSGIVTLDPLSGDATDVALLGSESILRLQTGSNGARVAVGSFSDSDESRQRADAQTLIPLSSAQSFSVTTGTEQGREYGNPTATLAGSFSFANVSFDDGQPSIDARASFTYDRGGYDATANSVSQSDVWSDADFTAGFRTRGPVQVFGDISERLSTGIYNATGYDVASIGAVLEQNRIDAGVNAIGPDYDVTAGIGLFGFSYGGGTGGVSAPSSGRLATPSLQLVLFPNSQWSATLEASDSFYLPTLWEQYDYNSNYDTVTYDRASLFAGALSYTDWSRVRLSLEEASQDVHGFTNGTVSSSGASLQWQVAPTIALRAWTLLASDATTPSGQVPYVYAGTQPNVNAFWATYENGDAVRADVIYRKDWLNGRPFYHVDGDLSGPIVRGLRWYAGVEDRLLVRHLDVGLRFAQ